MLQRSLISCGLLLIGAGLATAQGRGHGHGCAFNAGAVPRNGIGPFFVPSCYHSYCNNPYYANNYGYGYGNYPAYFGASIGLGYPFGYYPAIGYGGYYPPIDPYAQQNPTNQQNPTDGVNPPPNPFQQQPVARAAPPAGEQMPPPRADIAEIIVNVPDDAEVWIEGVKMKQTGPRRRFVSPTLSPGVSYAYEIRATWTQDGRKVTDSNQVTVHGGDRASLTFIARPKRPDAAITKADK